MSESQKYRRVLLKLSGEALMGDKAFGIDQAMVERIAEEVCAVQNNGTEVCIVIGGGNIFRGVAGVASGIDRSSADHMGMLATVMNSIAVQSMLERKGVETRVLSAIPMAAV
ncbi:MAG: UMP kinase, partial [Sphingomonadales bacterium]